MEGGGKDVLCRIHFFNEKEDLMQRAWDKRPPENRIFYSYPFAILIKKDSVDENENQTIARTDQNKIWMIPMGLSLSIDILLHNAFFRLQSCEKLQDVFKILKADPIIIPNWSDVTDTLRP